MQKATAGGSAALSEIFIYGEQHHNETERPGIKLMNLNSKRTWYLERVW